MLMIALITLYLTQWLYPSQIKEQVDDHVHAMHKHLNTLSILLVRPLLENDLSEIYTTLDELKLKNENWDDIQLHSLDGTQLYPLQTNASLSIKSKNNKFKSNKSKKNNYETTVFNEDNNNKVKLTHSVDYYGKSLGIITLYYNIETIKEHFTSDLYNVNFILIIGIILFSLLSLIIIEVLVRYPLSKLSYAASQMSQGVFDAPLPKEKPDEVGSLIKCFKLMRSNIQSYQQSLKKEIEDRCDLQHELQRRKLELEDQKLALDLHSIVSISNEFGQYSYVNDKLCDISGYMRDELLGMNQYMLLTEGYQETFFTDLISHLQSNQVWKGDVKSRDKCGKEFIADMTIVPFHDDHGKLYQYITIMTDITVLKNIEVELRKSTQQIQNILDSSPTILISAKPSGAFTLVYVSDNIEAILGYVPDDIINKPNFWFEHIHPDDRLRILKNMVELFSSGHYEDDYRVMDTSGNYHWFNNQLNMVYDSGGEPVEIIGSLTDITERRYIDEALRLIAFATATASDEKFFTLLVSNLAQALHVDYAYVMEYADEDKTRMRTIAAWEKNKIVDSVEYELAGTPCYEVMTNGELKQYSTGVQNTFPQDIPLKEQQAESYLGVPFRDSSGLITGSLVVIDTKPMTASSRLTSIFKIFASRAGAELERQHAKQELVQYRDNLQLMVDEQTHDLIETRDAALSAERAMSGFLANMSHELRTPLHGILSFSRFGIKKIDTAAKEKLLDYFTEIHDSGSNLLKLVNDLLDLSKLRAGKMAYEYSQCDMISIIKSVSDELYAFAIEQDIRFEISDMESTQTSLVTMDKERVMQVLRNIFVNALKYSPKNTLVKININYSKNESIQVSVCDEGVGIPDDELTLIFEAFSQSSNTKTSAGGTGLGLPICKEIIEQGHKGWIKAENRGDGGTCFIFAIPRTQSGEKNNQYMSES